LNLSQPPCQSRLQFSSLQRRWWHLQRAYDSEGYRRYPEPCRSPRGAQLHLHLAATPCGM